MNQDGLGNLRGYGYGANIGSINFENTGGPKVDLKTGDFSGYAYSANCGWIALTNAAAFVQTDTLYPGPLSTNGLPIPWLLANFGTTNVKADSDGDGMNNQQEYLAGTNPLDGNDKLRITAFNAQPGGVPATVTWQSTPTRCYFLQTTLDVATPSWLDSGLGLIAPDGASTTRIVSEANAPKRFYRIQAVNPLAP
ncbi:MAG TPA: thrombospondin type 3 repeat-containing protein [Pirellulales bacterium]